MKTIYTLAAGVSLVLGGMAFMGCADNSQPAPQTSNDGTAGGNGAFGTNPQGAGQYGTVQPNSDTSGNSSQSNQNNNGQ